MTVLCKKWLAKSFTGLPGTLLLIICLSHTRAVHLLFLFQNQHPDYEFDLVKSILLWKPTFSRSTFGGTLMTNSPLDSMIASMSLFRNWGWCAAFLNVDEVTTGENGSLPSGSTGILSTVTFKISVCLLFFWKKFHDEFRQLWKMGQCRSKRTDLPAVQAKLLQLQIWGHGDLSMALLSGRLATVKCGYFAASSGFHALWWSASENQSQEQAVVDQCCWKPKGIGAWRDMISSRN